MRELIVVVSIRKGLGPEWQEKHFPVAFDDLPADLTDYEIKQMAKNEVEQGLYRSEDYSAYGKNWEIVEIVNA
jgi:hypothetical protein